MSVVLAALAPSTTAFEPWRRARVAHFERIADAALPATTQAPRRLHEAMRYAVLDGGKRVRPLLVYAAAELAGAASQAADSAALAVEYVHVYSLAHDDLPCMDNDVLRRGKPTLHVAYDEATAMLAGDALQAEAFRLLAEAPLPAESARELMRTLARAASTGGMCGGQAIDLSSVGRTLSLPELEQMHRMKTGALLAAAVRMGALCGPAGALDAGGWRQLDTCAAALGLAFQIVDDLLDVEASSAALGKTAGKDAAQNKPTYVSVLGLAGARARAAELHVQASAALAALETEGAFRGRTLRLRQLADFIGLRSH